MNSLSAGGLLTLLACATLTHAAETRSAGCDAMVGVWEYVPPSAPGHAVIARHGDKYLGIFINTLPMPYSEYVKPGTARTSDATKPDSHAVVGAWEYTCDATPSKLRLTYRWLYSSYRPEDVGTEFALDVEVVGNEGKWWYIGPDGKRGTMGAGRLVK